MPFLMNPALISGKRSRRMASASSGENLACVTLHSRATPDILATTRKSTSNSSGWTVIEWSLINDLMVLTARWGRR